MATAQSIYVLVWADPPATYVGKSRSPRQRLHTHRHDAHKRAARPGKGTDTLLYRFWRKYGDPEMRVLETREFADKGEAEQWAQHAERAQIAAYRATGTRVLNTTAGGESAGEWWHNPEIRARHRRATSAGVLSALRAGRGSGTYRYAGHPPQE